MFFFRESRSFPRRAEGRGAGAEMPGGKINGPLIGTTVKFCPSFCQYVNLHDKGRVELD